MLRCWDFLRPVDLETYEYHLLSLDFQQRYTIVSEIIPLFLSLSLLEIG